jgi:hypothetical protein
MDVPIEAYGLLAILCVTLVVTVALTVWAYRRDRKFEKNQGFDHDESDPEA